jgi:hypothetical protein
MYAVVTNVTLKNPEQATSFLRDQIVPRVKDLPGLVNGYWARADQRGASMVVFETEEQAREYADQAMRPPEDVVTIDSMEVREVVASV